MKIGENGELRFSTISTTKIDVTEMANAQARLIAKQKLSEQKKITDARLKKEKNARSKERLLWIASIVGGAYLLTK